MKKEKLHFKKFIVIGLVMAYMCVAVACRNNNNDTTNPSGDMAGDGSESNGNVNGSTTDRNDNTSTTDRNDNGSIYNDYNDNGYTSNNNILDDNTGIVGDTLNGISDTANDVGNTIGNVVDDITGTNNTISEGMR